MTNQQIKTIIGALVAIGLVIAVSYGLISQQTADQIKSQTDQTLSNGQATPAPNAAPQPSAPQSPAAPGGGQPNAVPPTKGSAPQQ